MAEHPAVRVGDEHYVLRPFKGLKAVLVLERVTKLLDVLPEVQAEARAVYRRQRQENLVAIPRNVFEMRYPEYAGQISDKAWAEADQMIKLPDATPLDSMAAFMSVLPKVLSTARNEVVEVLALVTMLDTDLEQFDENETVDEEVQKRAKQILYKGDLDQIAELATKSFGLISEMNSGKVRELFTQATALLSLDLTDEDEDPLPMPTNPEDSSETSSTSSPGSTDGPDAKPSGSDGMTSSPSPSE